jgi:hypothetical protein
MWVKMDKKNIAVISIILISIIALTIFSMDKGATILGLSEDVRMPLFTAIECKDSGFDLKLPNDNVLTNHGCNNNNQYDSIYGCQLSSDDDVYACPYSNGYTPNGCLFTVTWAGSGLPGKLSKVLECDSNKQNCISKETFMAGNKQDFRIPSGKTFIINVDYGFGIFQKAYLTGKADMFGLYVTHENNFREKTADCTLSSLKADYDYASFANQPLDDFSKGEVLAESEIIHVVTGTTLGQTTNLVKRSDVEGGNIIYVLRPGVYYKVITAKDGTKYVDTTREYTNTKIECNPGLPHCTDDAKWDSENTAAGTCQTQLGNYAGYVPTSLDKSCKYQCLTPGASKPTPTSDCIDRNPSCPSDKPFYNTVLKQCVAGNSGAGFQEANINWTALLIGALVAIFASILSYYYFLKELTGSTLINGILAITIGVITFILATKLTLVIMGWF